MPRTLRIRVSAPCGDYISQKALRRLPAVEAWRPPSQRSQAPPLPASLRLPSGVSPLGIGPLPRRGWPSRSWGLVLSGEWGRPAPSRLHSGCVMQETRRCGVSVGKGWRWAAAGPAASTYTRGRF